MSLLGLKQYFIWLFFFFLICGQIYIPGQICNFCFFVNYGYFGNLVES